MTTQPKKSAPKKNTKKSASPKPTVSDGTVTLTLKVKKEDHQKAYQSVLKSAAKSVEVKGFRKGHAPLNLVEKSLDKSRLFSQVLELVLTPAYREAITKEKISPIVEPRITPTKMEEDKDWEFKAETAGVPEVKLGKYKEAIKKELAQARKDQEGGKDKPKENWEYTVVMDQILSTTEVEPAEILIEEEAHSAIHKLEGQLAQIKLSLADYLKSIKKSEKEFHNEYHQTARDNLRLEFALKAIVDAENPEIDEKDLKKLNPPQGQEIYYRYLLQKQKMLDTLTKL